MPQQSPRLHQPAPQRLHQPAPQRMHLQRLHQSEPTVVAGVAAGVAVGVGLGVDGEVAEGELALGMRKWAQEGQRKWTLQRGSTQRTQGRPCRGRVGEGEGRQKGLVRPDGG